MKITKEQFDRFKDEVKARLSNAGLDEKVTLDIFFHGPNSWRQDYSVELDEITAHPMRQGYGSRALEILTETADKHGIPIWLKVANETDDTFEYDEDDPEAPPSEQVLIDLYERFGFEISALGYHTIMERMPQERPIGDDAATSMIPGQADNKRPEQVSVKTA